MFWKGIEIKNLRRRLGWSKTDLARRLKCSVETVELWELDDGAPDFHQSKLLELLSTQSESVNRDLQSAPIVEKILDQTGQTQISESEILEDLD